MAGWEKGNGALVTTEKLLRVVYLSHSKGDPPVRFVVERINAIERAMKQAIVLHERKGFGSHHSGKPKKLPKKCNASPLTPANCCARMFCRRWV